MRWFTDFMDQPHHDGAAIADQDRFYTAKRLVDAVHQAYLHSRASGVKPTHPSIKRLHQDVAQITARAKPKPRKAAGAGARHHHAAHGHPKPRHGQPSGHKQAARRKASPTRAKAVGQSHQKITVHEHIAHDGGAERKLAAQREAAHSAAMKVFATLGPRQRVTAAKFAASTLPPAKLAGFVLDGSSACANSASFVLACANVRIVPRDARAQQCVDFL